MVLQFWQGDWIRAQNLWRRWMLAHNLPRPAASCRRCKWPACSSHQFGEMIHANTANQNLFVDRYLEERLPLDYWWMDAGWYWSTAAAGRTPAPGRWTRNRFPARLAGHLRPRPRQGRQDHRLVRAGAGRPRHLAVRKTTPSGCWAGRTAAAEPGQSARPASWLTDHVDQLLTEQGIDLYRQDFNMDPLELLAESMTRRTARASPRTTTSPATWPIGTSCSRRHPNMLIDSCASGGRRNDLETLRRAVPLLRSDYIIEPVGNQCHTYGLSFWVPFNGTGTGGNRRSTNCAALMCPHFTACLDMRGHGTWPTTCCAALGQWRRYAGFTWRLLSADAVQPRPAPWMAWQFDRPRTAKGWSRPSAGTRASMNQPASSSRVLSPGRYSLITNLHSGEKKTSPRAAAVGKRAAGFRPGPAGAHGADPFQGRMKQ